MSLAQRFNYIMNWKKQMVSCWPPNHVQFRLFYTNSINHNLDFDMFMLSCGNYISQFDAMKAMIPHYVLLTTRVWMLFHSYSIWMHVLISLVYFWHVNQTHNRLWRHNTILNNNVEDNNYVTSKWEKMLYVLQCRIQFHDSKVWGWVTSLSCEQTKCFPCRKENRL